MKRVSAGHEAKDEPTVLRSRTTTSSMPACPERYCHAHACGAGADDNDVVDVFSARAGHLERSI